MTSPVKKPTRIIFWDIDGTLLLTGRAGMIAWERAFAAAAPGAAFPTTRPDGMTDHQIAASLLAPVDTTLEGAWLDAAAADLVARYERELVDALPLRQGRVLENVLDVLTWLRTDQAAPKAWLVTGNTRAGAAAKLEHYGLADSFSAPGPDGSPFLLGAFSERIEPRACVVARALAAAQEAWPGLLPSEALVIGDTPHDIEGAHAVGVPVLALATNINSAEELSSYAPWRTIAPLPGRHALLPLLLTAEGVRASIDD